jgi:raffinose/stachyose/melibiose transport system permease protein
MNRSRWLLQCLCILWAALNVLPFLWTLNNSFKQNNEIASSPLALPRDFSFGNYREAWKTANLGRIFRNSVVVSASAVALSVMVSSMAAFVLTRMRSGLGTLLYSLFALGYMVPGQAVLLPVFITIKRLGLLNSYAGLVIPYVSFNMAFNVMLITAFMRSIPQSLSESAEMDGCAMPVVFFRIILPLSRSVLATAAVLNALWTWNDYVYALVLMSKPAMMTVSLGLAFFRTATTTYYGHLSAVVVMSIAPILALYIALKQHVISGLTAGAVKG